MENNLTPSALRDAVAKVLELEKAGWHYVCDKRVWFETDGSRWGETPGIVIGFDEMAQIIRQQQAEIERLRADMHHAWLLLEDGCNENYMNALGDALDILGNNLLTEFPAGIGGGSNDPAGGDAEQGEPAPAENDQKEQPNE